MKQIDIRRGYPVVVLIMDPDSRVTFAGHAAMWCASRANAAWCIAPDPTGEIEVTFALDDDRQQFAEWMATTMQRETVQ